ncbi:Rieske (2Fe-2S) protein [Cellulomonas sp. NS3]|uniref:Rieske (2Fe-2S) protein n=1 Tax=Cellulomonas sp. NS3 TaxID=2973977 RepID=UPI0021630AEE|nr:Rieske (2Fe-2S) protein [Cellulomonas sp. NS3]
MTPTTDPTPTDRAPTRAAHAAGACGSACHGLTRRSVLRGAGAASLGAAALVLAACAGPSDADGAPAGAEGGASAGGGSGVLAKLADVPVGGALAVTGPDDVPLLLLQPTAGTVVALVAVCTHQGCTVVADGDALVCPCHGSVFSPEDGSVIVGPAEEPLAAFPVELVDGGVVAA